MNNSHDEPPETVLIECDLPEPPEKVWRAVTEPELVEAWLGSAESGAANEREIIEARPNERVRYRWRDREEGQSLDSIVTFELSPTPAGGTHLRLVQTDFAIAVDAIATVMAFEPCASVQRKRTPPMASAIAYRSLRRAA